MIIQHEGPWSLNSFAGRYAFDNSTGWLTAGDERVGHFICDRIQSSKLQLPSSFSKLTSMNLRILSSEIMAEIHKEANHGALFVIPSQFNGAEYPYHTDIVFKVEDYKHDNSSGPRAQLAGHPAVAQFILDNAANIRRPTGGINALRELLMSLPEFDLMNGYLKITEGVNQEEVLRRLQDQLHVLRPLVMEAVPVKGLTPDQRGIAKGKHRVGFVYASAVPVDSYLNREGDSKFQSAVAELFLVAQYYGALRYAAQAELAQKNEVKTKPRKVFLMPLGTGVFHNSWEVIARSMAKAIQMLDDDLLALLEVTALARQGNPSDPCMKHALRRRTKEEMKLREIFYQLNKYAPNACASGLRGQAPQCEADDVMHGPRMKASKQPK